MYFFFSETGKEFDFFENTIVSRIARVCKVSRIVSSGGGGRAYLLGRAAVARMPGRVHGGGLSRAN